MKRGTTWFACMAIALCLVTKESTGDDSNVAGNHAKEQYSAFDSASWAVTSNRLSPMLGADKQSLYDGFVADCNSAISEKNGGRSGVCTHNERARLRMNSRQPSSVYNYTKDGYAKIRAPTELYDLLKEWFEENRHLAETEWKEYNVYHNAWESPPTFINFQGKYMGGSSLTSRIADGVQPILERWTGQRLNPVSTYGIRLYHNNSILAPHVDRMPLITSAIIQVDQDVDEPWPLEVYGHDGIGRNITMQPGDMVLYESHSVIHGRPFPMIGNFFANCFIHFEPYEPIEGESLYDPDLDLPPYLVPGSAWEGDWKMANPNGWKGMRQSIVVLAVQGNTKQFEKRIRTDPKELHDADVNGWTVLHESVRVGALEIVKIILNNGVDKDLLTYTGVTPLSIARHYLEAGHELIEYLESLGAEDISPGRKRHREL